MPKRRRPKSAAGSARVRRGGSWYSVDDRVLRASDRFRFVPGSRGDYLGFRCVRDVAGLKEEKRDE
jgi:formylglycine-generating enzyme required for sulfatase activity